MERYRHPRRHPDARALIYEIWDKQWKGIVILGGIGSVTSMTLANPIDHGPPPTIGVKKFDEPLEVLGFTGELFAKGSEPDNMPGFARDNPTNYVIHIHASVSHSDGSMSGGGYREATVMRGLNL